MKRSKALLKIAQRARRAADCAPPSTHSFAISPHERATGRTATHASTDTMAARRECGRNHDNVQPDVPPLSATCHGMKTGPSSATTFSKTHHPNGSSEVGKGLGGTVEPVVAPTTENRPRRFWRACFFRAQNTHRDCRGRRRSKGRPFVLRLSLPGHL